MQIPAPRRKTHSHLQGVLHKIVSLIGSARVDEHCLTSQESGALVIQPIRGLADGLASQRLPDGDEAKFIRA
jgi:hypothetical protein